VTVIQARQNVIKGQLGRQVDLQIQRWQALYQLAGIQAGLLGVAQVITQHIVQRELVRQGELWWCFLG